MGHVDAHPSFDLPGTHSMDDHSEPEFSMGSLLHAAAVWATYWPHTLATATLACTLLAVHLRKAIMTVVFEALQRTHAGVGGVFHTGLFQPTPHELHITKPLPVLSGYVPPELDGYYMRTGPNPQFDPIGGYHLFDGEAMIHCVQFKAGAATAYCNHWVRCERFENERKAGHNIYIRIGDMRGLQGLLMIIVTYLFPFNLPGRKYKGKEQAAMGNTALACHRGRLLALNEAGYPIEVKVSSEGSMSTGEVVRYEGRLDHPFTAHPKIDPATNEMCFFGYEIGLTSPVTYSTVSADGRLSKGTAIDVQRAQLMHDFGITPNYAVFIDQNLVMTPQALMKPCKKLPFAIENGFNGRLGLLRRSVPEAGVAWFDLGRAVGWAAHVGNAWEDADGSRVHIVITQYDQLDLSAEEFTLGGGIARLVRLSLHVASGHVEWTQLVTDPHLHFEFPVISPRAVGQPCRYMYVVYSDIRYSHTRVAFDGIARIDMHAAAGEGLQGRTAFPDGFKGGELSFVPRKLAAAAVGPRNHEDGYIVGFITNEETQQSRLAVYDSFFTFEDPSFPDPPGPAMIQMPHRIPLGFHGLFVRQDELGAKQV